MLSYHVRLAFIFISAVLSALALNAAGLKDRFESQHFEYVSDSELSDTLKERIIEAAEATHGLLSLWSTESTSPQKVFLFRDESHYIKAGGIHGSAGVHCSIRNTVLVRLGEQSQNTLSLPDQRVLIHEVCHQMLQELLGEAPPWLSEGVAVYVESIPFHAGRFQEDWVDFRRAPILRANATGRIQTLPLAVLLRSQRSDWNAHFSSNLYGVDRQYQTAYLMTYYLVHLNAAPSQKPLGQFLEALMETLESTGSSAQTFRTGIYQLSTAECQQLENQLIASYESIGLSLEPLRGHILNN